MSQQNIPKILRTNILPNSTVIIAVSGGPDSLYLLHQCLQIQKNHGLKIIVAHLNHDLRQEESDKDAIFVEKTAKTHQLLYESLKVNLKKKKGNLEELGRNARYAFFEKVRQKYQASWILTAHHLNDNIETALLNLVRGSSLNGIKGMQTISPQKHLFRPLLSISKNEILDYLKKHHLPYRIDKTNNDPKFSRNLLRKKIVPLLKKINPGFEQTFAHNLQNFTEMADFLEKISEKWLEKWLVKNIFPLETFLKEIPFMQKNILATWYKNLYGSTNKLTSPQLEAILKVLDQRKANRKKEFGFKYFLKIDHGISTSHLIKLEPKNR